MGPRMIGVVLAGGTGSRLWPVSRQQYPKQFLSLDGEDSLLRETVERVDGYVDEVERLEDSYGGTGGEEQ